MNLLKDCLHFVFDVESVGLHGKAFSFGCVVVDGTGASYMEKECGLPERYGGVVATQEDIAWVDANVPVRKHTDLRFETMARHFAGALQGARELAAKENKTLLVWGECIFPVETNFFQQCVASHVPVERKAYTHFQIDTLDYWRNYIEDARPYPLHEIATVMLLAGMDPLATYERQEDELPKHTPLADARQSARLLLMALNKLQNKGGE